MPTLKDRVPEGGGWRIYLLDDFFWKISLTCESGGKKKVSKTIGGIWGKNGHEFKISVSMVTLRFGIGFPDDLSPPCEGPDFIKKLCQER